MLTVVDMFGAQRAMTLKWSRRKKKVQCVGGGGEGGWGGVMCVSALFAFDENCNSP